jgi:release factor glutamine methyltransferase
VTSAPGEAEVVARLRAAGCVFAEDEARLLLEAATGPQLAALVARRVVGEPLEQILGWASFGGLRVAVVPGVFVPRRRTELLAREAVAVTPPGSVVVDLCCGCGAVLLVVATAVPGVELHAADVDPVAVECARANLTGRGVADGRVYAGDLFAALPTRLRGRVAVLAANTPYVPTAEIARMPPEARDHEPPVALDGGADGLAVARRVVAGAPGWLAPGGHVLVETSRRQAPVLAVAAEAAGLTPRVVTDDALGGTVVVGQLPA